MRRRAHLPHRVRDSNLGPLGCERSLLTNKLRGVCVCVCVCVCVVHHGQEDQQVVFAHARGENTEPLY